MRKPVMTWLANVRHAQSIWGKLPSTSIGALKQLTQIHALSVAGGDLLFLEGRWYITHSGLLRIAQRRRCSGIKTVIQDRLSDPSSGRWVFRATVYKNSSSRGFVGYGDADPSNVSCLVHGAEMRVAETRAVNRALRKAYGIGLCSVEELGWAPRPNTPGPAEQRKAFTNGNNGHKNRQPRLRDQLCLLIRQYKLDPTLVKAYAADFCGTQSIKEASRDLVESFISQLATSAKQDWEGLQCKLNSFAQPMEAKP